MGAGCGGDIEVGAAAVRVSYVLDGGNCHSFDEMLLVVRLESLVAKCSWPHEVLSCLTSPHPVTLAQVLPSHPILSLNPVPKANNLPSHSSFHPRSDARSNPFPFPSHYFSVSFSNPLCIPVDAIVCRKSESKASSSHSYHHAW